MSSDTPYTRMSDEETPTFNTDTERSKWLSIADSSIEHDQERLRKLKFLVTPLFQNVGRLKDAKSVVDIHRALYMDPEYDGDEKRAASDLYVLLGIVGMEKFKNCSTSDSEAEVTSIRSSDKFKWRVELVHLSDKATKHKRDSKLIDHLFDSYEIKMSRESVTSPIPLYEYLIEKGFFKPGEEKDLEELKNAVTFCNQYVCIIITLLVVLSVILTVIAAGCFLSLIKFADIENLESTRPVFFNGPVTLMVGGQFDLRYYSIVAINMTTNTTMESNYTAQLCQSVCDAGIIERTIPLDYSEELDASGAFSSRCYLPIPGFSYPSIPTIFMLKGSSMQFNFAPILDTPPNLTVSLHIFTDVRKCMRFNNHREGVLPHRVLNLTQSGGFSGMYNSTTDDYVCVVVQLPNNQAHYNFTVNATVHQYQNMSYLLGEGLCNKTKSQYFLTPRREGMPPFRLDLKLSRPFSAASSSSPHATCLLISFQEAVNGSVIELSSTIFGTTENLGLILVSVVGVVALVGAGVMLMCLLCVCYYR